MATDEGVQPGWYADPLRRFELRWFNGRTWTADVVNDGDRFVDPLGLEPGTQQGSGAAAGAHRSRGPTASNSAATTAMALGIVAVAISWMPFVVVLGVVAAILAIAFGWAGVRRAGAHGDGRGRAIIGIATGAGALAAAVIGVALSIIVFSAFQDYAEPAPHEAIIDDCTLAGSRASTTGTIENLGSDDADFSILIGFVRSGTDNPDGTVRISLDDVAPGERRTFDAQRQVELDGIDCIIIEVNGPLPFGVEVD